MSLPVIEHPRFDVKIPSTKNTITLRPFTVREEKILLMSQTSDDMKDTIDSIKQVLGNCIVTGLMNNPIEKMATFDVEYLFLKLRAKSVGEIIEVKFSETDPDDKDKKITYTAEINLDEVEVKFPKDHSKTIKFTDTIGLTMRYPTFNQISSMENRIDDIDSVLSIFLQCVDTVYDADKVYVLGDDFDIKELEEFILNLDTSASEKIANFFDTMPVLEHVITATNEKSGDTKEYTLQGMSDFFT